MRNKSLLLCLALAGALAAVSCKPEPSKGDENGGNGGEQGEITYPFSVNEKISGTFKAGVHDAVVIEGDGFRAGLDSVAVIWQEEGDDMFETVKVAEDGSFWGWKAVATHSFMPCLPSHCKHETAARLTG